MGLIFDTCILIQIERSNTLPPFHPNNSEESVYISAITASELLMGVHYADTEARRIKRSTFVESILAKIPILNFTKEIARVHAEISTYLSKQGKNIGAHDLIIAATAIAHDYTLLTANEKEFSRVPALKLAQHKVLA